MLLPTSTPASGGILDLGRGLVALLTICMIGASGFICSHLCEKLMVDTPHSLSGDVYCHKICHLVDPLFYGVCPG